MIFQQFVFLIIVRVFLVVLFFRVITFIIYHESHVAYVMLIRIRLFRHGLALITFFIFIGVVMNGLLLVRLLCLHEFKPIGVILFGLIFSLLRLLFLLEGRLIRLACLKLFLGVLLIFEFIFLFLL